MSVTPLRARQKGLESHRSQKLPSTPVFLLMQRERGKKIGGGRGVRPQVSWPMARRSVRGWLEPWIMLRRYWNGWSQLPPPPALQLLLRWLERGHAIALYSSACSQVHKVPVEERVPCESGQVKHA